MISNDIAYVGNTFVPTLQTDRYRCPTLSTDIFTLFRYMNDPVNNRLRRGGIRGMACRNFCDINLSATVLLDQIDHATLVSCRDNQILLTDQV